MASLSSCKSLHDFFQSVSSKKEPIANASNSEVNSINAKKRPREEALEDKCTKGSSEDDEDFLPNPKKKKVTKKLNNGVKRKYVKRNKVVNVKEDVLIENNKLDTKIPSKSSVESHSDCNNKNKENLDGISSKETCESEKLSKAPQKLVKEQDKSKSESILKNKKENGNAFTVLMGNSNKKVTFAEESDSSFSTEQSPNVEHKTKKNILSYFSPKLSSEACAEVKEISDADKMASSTDQNDLKSNNVNEDNSTPKKIKEKKKSKLTKKTSHKLQKNHSIEKEMEDPDEVKDDDNLTDLTNKMHALTKKLKKKKPMKEENKDDEIDLDKLTSKMHKLTKRIKKSKNKISDACVAGGNIISNKVNGSKSSYNIKTSDNEEKKDGELSLINHQKLVSDTIDKTIPALKEDVHSTEIKQSPSISSFFKKVNKSEFDSKRNKQVFSVAVEVHATQSGSVSSPKKLLLNDKKIISPQKATTNTEINAIEFHGQVELTDSDVKITKESEKLNEKENCDAEQEIDNGRVENSEQSSSINSDVNCNESETSMSIEEDEEESKEEFDISQDEPVEEKKVARSIFKFNWNSKLSLKNQKLCNKKDSLAIVMDDENSNGSDSKISVWSEDEDISEPEEMNVEKKEVPCDDSRDEDVASPEKSEKSPEKPEESPEKFEESPEKSEESPEYFKASVEKSVPSPEKSVPSPEKSVPSPEKSVPSPEKSVPSPEKYVPSPEKSEASPEKSEAFPGKSGASSKKSEASPEKSKASQEKPEASQEKPEASQEKPEASQEKPEASQEKPEASQEKPEASQEKPEASQEKPEASQEKPEASQEKPEASQEKPEASQEKPEASQEEPEASQEEPEASQEEPEASQEEPEASQEEPEASQEKPEASQEEPEASQEEPEASQEKPEESPEEPEESPEKSEASLEDSKISPEKSEASLEETQPSTNKKEIFPGTAETPTNERVSEDEEMSSNKGQTTSSLTCVTGDGCKATVNYDLQETGAAPSSPRVKNTPTFKKKISLKRFNRLESGSSSDEESDKPTKVKSRCEIDADPDFVAICDDESPVKKKRGRKKKSVKITPKQNQLVNYFKSNKTDEKNTCEIISDEEILQPAPDKVRRSCRKVAKVHNYDNMVNGIDDIIDEQSERMVDYQKVPKGNGVNIVGRKKKVSKNILQVHSECEMKDVKVCSESPKEGDSTISLSSSDGKEDNSILEIPPNCTVGSTGNVRRSKRPRMSLMSYCEEKEPKRRKIKDSSEEEDTPVLEKKVKKKKVPLAAIFKTLSPKTVEAASLSKTKTTSKVEEVVKVEEEVMVIEDSPPPIPRIFSYPISREDHWPTIAPHHVRSVEEMPLMPLSDKTAIDIDQLISSSINDDITPPKGDSLHNLITKTLAATNQSSQEPLKQLTLGQTYSFLVSLQESNPAENVADLFSHYARSKLRAVRRFEEEKRSMEKSESVTILDKSEVETTKARSNRRKSTDVKDSKDSSACPSSKGWSTLTPYMWTDVCAPQHLRHNVGNKGSLSLLFNWLESWKVKCEEQSTVFGTPKKTAKKRKNLLSATSGIDSDCNSDFIYDSEDSCASSSGMSRSSGNTVMLAGPTGCGKTAAVYSLAKQLGYKVLEVNASSRRTGKGVLAKLAEATQSQSVKQSQSHFLSSADSHKLLEMQMSPAKQKTNPIASMFMKKQKIETGAASNKKKTKTETKKSTKLSRKNSTVKEKEAINPVKEVEKNKNYTLVLFEDIDLVFGEKDDGFISAVNSLMLTSKRPIIVTTTSPTPANLLKHPHTLRQMLRPHSSLLTLHLQLMGLVMGGCALSQAEVSDVVNTTQCDVRAALHLLQYRMLAQRVETLPSTEDLKIFSTFSKLEMETIEEPATLKQIFGNLKQPNIENLPIKSSLREVDTTNLFLYPKQTEGNCVDKIALRETIPLFYSDGVIPLLLPFPKYYPAEKKYKYPLSLEDPTIRKVPLYQKYSWLDVASSSDEDDVKKKEVKEENDSKSTEGVSELRNFRKNTEDKMVDASEVETTEFVTKEESPKEKIIKPVDPLRDMNINALDAMSKFYNNLTDMDILAGESYIGEDIGFVSNNNFERDAFSFTTKTLSIDSLDFTFKRTLKPTESLEDSCSTLKYKSPVLTRSEIVTEINNRIIRSTQTRLENIKWCNKQEMKILDDLLKSNDNTSFSVSINDVTELGDNFSLCQKIQLSTSLPKLLSCREYQTDMLSMYRLLARQDAVNVAVNMLKRKRKRFNRSGLLASILNTHLSQKDSDRLCNALTEHS